MLGWHRIKASTLLLALVLFIHLLVAQAFAACGDMLNWQKADVNEDDLLIVVLRVNHRPLSTSIDLYPYKNTYLLPISQLGEYFDLPWEFQVEPRRFWSSYSKNSALSCNFNIDFSSSPNAKEVFWYSDDFDTYVDVNIIAELLEGAVELNFELLQINFTSSFDLLGITSNTSGMLPSLFSAIKPKEYPIIRDTYSLFTLPLVNYRSNLNYNATQKKVRHRTNVNAFFDLAYMSAEYRLGLTNNKQQNFLRFSKNFSMNTDEYSASGSIQNIDDKAIKYEFGDISIDGDELVSTSKQTLGFNAFSYSQNQRRNFSNTRIEETVLPGWRGLLFRNGQFIAEAESTDSNQIIFEDVSTFFGTNAFEIRLFGPEGQEEIRKQVVNVGRQQLRAGEFDFRVYAADAKRRLLDGYLENGKSGKQFAASGNLGLSTSTVMNVDLQRIETDNGHYQDYASIGLDANFGSNLLRIRHAQQMTKGNAFFVGLDSKINKHLQTRIEHVALNNFSSDKYTEERQLKSETKANATARIPLDKQINVNFAYLERRFNDGKSNRNISTTFSHNFMGSTLSNTIAYSDTQNQNSLSHRAFWSHGLRDWRFRHSLAWQPFDKNKIESFNTNIRWPQTLRAFNETKFSYRANRPAKYELSHQTNWRNDRINLQFGGSIDNKGHWSLKFGITGDLFYNKNKHRLDLSRPKGSKTAELDAFAFIDWNRDGKFDDGDESLPNVSFSGSSTWKKTRTTNTGQAQLFTSTRYQTIEIDENSLFDPFVTPTVDGYIVATHAGGINQVAFPVVTVNDVEGLVGITRENESRGLGGLTIKLLAIGGGDYYTTKSENDGFFFFSKIPPGKYIMSFDDAFLDSRNLAMPNEAIVVEASEEGDIVSIDLIEFYDKNAANKQKADETAKEANRYEGLQKLAYLSVKPLVKERLDGVFASKPKINSSDGLYVSNHLL